MGFAIIAPPPSHNETEIKLSLVLHLHFSLTYPYGDQLTYTCCVVIGEYVTIFAVAVRHTVVDNAGVVTVHVLTGIINWEERRKEG